MSDQRRIVFYTSAENGAALDAAVAHLGEREAHRRIEQAIRRALDVKPAECGAWRPSDGIGCG